MQIKDQEACFKNSHAECNEKQLRTLSSEDTLCICRIASNNVLSHLNDQTFFEQPQPAQTHEDVGTTTPVERISFITFQDQEEGAQNKTIDIRKSCKDIYRSKVVCTMQETSTLC